jgi:hypothetical protein
MKENETLLSFIAEKNRKEIASKKKSKRTRFEEIVHSKYFGNILKK